MIYVILKTIWSDFLLKKLNNRSTKRLNINKGPFYRSNQIKLSSKYSTSIEFIPPAWQYRTAPHRTETHRTARNAPHRNVTFQKCRYI